MLPQVIVQNAQEMFDHLSQNHVLPESTVPAATCCHKKRSFEVVKTEQINRTLPSSALLTVPGTRQIHHVRGRGNGVIATRKLACFCKYCLGLGTDECAYKDFVLSWDHTKVRYSKKWQENMPGSSDSTPPTSPSSVPEPAQCPSPSDPQEGISTAEQDTPSRLQFFASLQEKLVRAESFEPLMNICTENVHSISACNLRVTEKFIATTPGLSVDAVSMHLLPQDAPDGHLPISIIGDGNCFPRTVSVLTLGTESHHVEMRVRIIIEMAVNFILYTDPIFLSKGSADDGTTLLAFLRKYADVPYDAVRSPVETLKEEIMRVTALGTECSMWHLFATANMLSLPLQSIFPDKGPIELQHLTKRTLLPEKQVGPRVHTMWTSHREDQSFCIPLAPSSQL